MSKVLLKLSHAIEIASAFVLIAGLVLTPADSSFADDEYNAGCTNGGGGKTTCVKNNANDGCTNSDQCDTPVTCTCQTGSTQKPCRCGGAS